MEVALPFLVSLGLLPMARPQGKLPLRNDLQEALYHEAGTGSHRMRGKRASFREEEAATWCVFASLCLEGTVSLIQQETSRSAQSTECQRQSRVSPFPFAILAEIFRADSGTAHEEASSGSTVTY